MAKLTTPKIDTNKGTIAKYCEEVCMGLTVFFIFGILWILIAALGYRIFLWVF